MNAKAFYLFRDFERAVKNLKAAVSEADTPLEIDGAIKRFELSYELTWKLMKEYLASVGIICKSPRDCFKAAKANDLIADESQWLKMIEDRNQLVHCYTFEQSRIIYNEIQAVHVKSLLKFYRAIRKEYVKSKG